jgi:hypothetical protein
MSRVQVKLAFHPNQANPARAGGRGVWRVKFCSALPSFYSPVHVWGDREGSKLLSLAVARVYKVNSRVDPKKLALEFLRSQQPMLAAA